MPRQGIDELYTLETLLEVAAQEALGKQVRIERLEEEIAIRERQLKWLDETALQVRERLRKRRPAPRLRICWTSSHAWSASCAKLPGRSPIAAAAIPSGFEEQVNNVWPYCRLARVYHPDHQPAEAETFLQLVAHRWDLMWLEALDGCYSTTTSRGSSWLTSKSASTR